MIIRLASMDTDADQIMAAAADFAARVEYRDAFVSDEDVREDRVRTVLSSPELEITVAEVDGGIVAGIGMTYTPFLWDPAVIEATEVFWWASPSAPATAAIRVLKAALNRAKGDGSTVVMASMTSLASSGASVGRTYERMGMQLAENRYVGVL